MKSVYRKKLRKARHDLMPHFDEVVEPLEKLRGLSEIIAKKHEIAPEELWSWVVRELTD